MTNTQEKKPRAVILSSALSQPRYHRRAAMLLEAGYNLQVYGYQRGYYEENMKCTPAAGQKEVKEKEE